MNQAHSLFNLEGIDPHGNNVSVDAMGLWRFCHIATRFLWLTRVVECVPGEHIVAELDVDPTLPLFNGHFLSILFARRHHYGSACPGGKLLRARSAWGRGRNRFLTGSIKEVSPSGSAR